MDYIDLLSEQFEIAGIKTKLTLDDRYYCGFLSNDYQFWIKLNPPVDLRLLSKLERKIPIWGIINGKDLRLFNFGKNCSQKINDERIIWKPAGVSKFMHRGVEFTLYRNYELFPGLEYNGGKTITMGIDDLINYAKTYKLDYSVWVYKLYETTFDLSYVSFIIRPKKFIVDSAFLAHKISPGSGELTISFLAELLEVFHKAYARRQRTLSLSLDFSKFTDSKKTFLDVFETKILSYFLEREKVPYEPQVGSFNIKARLDYIISRLQMVGTQ
ncbi:MAG: hypothetical protein QW228_05540 [Candidatus Aenigmatarchaeota archaeon]